MNAAPSPRDMLLTITTTHRPATDLGYLLSKHPDRFQSFDASFGRVHAFYPEATEERCTFALLLDVDPVALVRGRGRDRGDAARAEAYVSDRPYAASSFTSVAISNVLGSALNGRSGARPDLARTPIPLEARIASLSCRGGEALLRRLFEPLGYRVGATSRPADAEFPEWGTSRHLDVVLTHVVTLGDLLSHLYVLVPVLDDEKHYWVSSAEVEKLIEKGRDWLKEHPERELISRRYLKHEPRLTRDALARLAEDDDPDPDRTESERAEVEATAERAMSLNERRLDAVVAALRASRARTVLDLGCGEGRLVAALLRSRTAGARDFDRVVGMDVSVRALETARERLRIDGLPSADRERIDLIHGSLTYRDARLAGFDAACLVEVVEHLDPPRLHAMERVVFEHARPRVVVMTTPNREYNRKFPTLATATFRHRDHRFEWTRDEFRAFCDGVAARRGYSVRAEPVGDEDADAGAPTQMGIFER